MHALKRSKSLWTVLILLGCLSLAGCGEEAEAPDAPPTEEEGGSFNDTTGGGSA